MDVSSSADEISVAALGGDEAVWQAFLAHAANGTLFHDLRFLRYHPEGRFRFHHLVFRRKGKVVALLPGGLDGEAERPLFRSPLGASVGGLAVAADLRAKTALALVEALQGHARERGWAGVEITLPPQCYGPETAGIMEFALFCRGFRLEHRWLCHVLPISPTVNDGYERAFRQNQVTAVRAARRKGVVGVERELEGLQDFLKVFRDTYQRHGVAATHSEAEIRNLVERFPDRIRIHLAMLGDVPIAGLLVFGLTAEVANIFYICTSSEHAGDHGAAVAVADALDPLRLAGFRYLDLGPSASDTKFNEGVAFFKEGLGAFGQCRDRWRWDAA